MRKEEACQLPTPEIWHWALLVAQAARMPLKRLSEKQSRSLIDQVGVIYGGLGRVTTHEE